jgi:hypothetical protein
MLEAAWAYRTVVVGPPGYRPRADRDGRDAARAGRPIASESDCIEFLHVVKVSSRRQLITNRTSHAKKRRTIIHDHVMRPLAKKIGPPAAAAVRAF